MSIKIIKKIYNKKKKETKSAVDQHAPTKRVRLRVPTSQGSKVRPRLPKNLYTLSFSLSLRTYIKHNPFVLQYGGVS